MAQTWDLLSQFSLMTLTEIFWFESFEYWLSRHSRIHWSYSQRLLANGEVLKRGHCLCTPMQFCAGRLLERAVLIEGTVKQRATRIGTAAADPSLPCQVNILLFISLCSAGSGRSSWQLRTSWRSWPWGTIFCLSCLGYEMYLLVFCSVDGIPKNMFAIWPNDTGNGQESCTGLTSEFIQLTVHSIFASVYLSTRWYRLVETQIWTTTSYVVLIVYWYYFLLVLCRVKLALLAYRVAWEFPEIRWVIIEQHILISAHMYPYGEGLFHCCLSSSHCVLCALMVVPVPEVFFLNVEALLRMQHYLLFSCMRILFSDACSLLQICCAGVVMCSGCTWKSRSEGCTRCCWSGWLQGKRMPDRITPSMP